MKDNYLKGIGSYWAQFFKDRDVLEAYGTASTEMLSAVYTDLSNVVLSISHEDIPVYDRAKWDVLVLSASDVEIVDSKYRFPLPAAFNTKGLRRSPEILSSVVSPKVILSQGYDFTIVDELIEFNADPFSNADIPLREVGGDLQITLWCPVADIDTNRIWRNYGHFIKRWRHSTPAYKNFVRGMFHTRMFGPIVNRIESGLQIIAGLPVADGRNETVLSIVKLDTQWVVKTTVRDYYIVPNVNLRVDIGDVLTPFQPLTDTVEVADYLTEPEWWNGNVNSLPPVIGETTDVNAAFDQYLKYNTFLVRINLTPYLRDISGLTPGNLFDAGSLVEFLQEFKPSYTYVFPLFFLRLTEEISPTVNVDVQRELHSLEDRHFGYPEYYTLSSGLDMSDGTTMESIGVEAGVSSVVPRNTMLGYLPEPYTQIPFIPYTLSEDINLSSGLDMSDGAVMGDVVTYDKWISPVEKTPLTMSNGVTMLDGRNMQSRHYAYRHYDMSMGKGMDGGIGMERFAKQGYVEEVGTSRFANITDEIDTDVGVGIVTDSSVRSDDLRFGPYDMSDGYDMSDDIHMGPNRSAEKFDVERILSSHESLVEDMGGVERAAVNMSSGFDMYDGITMSSGRERIPRYYIMGDSFTMSDGLDCSSLMRLRLAVDASINAQSLCTEEAAAVVDSAVVAETSHVEEVEVAVGFGVVAETLHTETIGQAIWDVLAEPIVVQWTSSSAGYYAGIIDQFVGTIGRVTVAPGAGGLAPDFGYKITIKDEHGIDVLAGIGTGGFSDTMPQSFVPLIDGQMVAVDGWLSVKIEGAGDANSGIVTLYLDGDIAYGLAGEVVVDSVVVAETLHSEEVEVTVGFGVGGEVLCSEEAGAAVDSGVVGETSHSEEVEAAVGFGVVGETSHSEGAGAAVGFGVVGETSHSEGAGAAVDSGVVGETSHSEEVEAAVGFGVVGETSHSEEVEVAVDFGVIAETLHPEEVGVVVDSGVIAETSHSEEVEVTVDFGVGGEVLCSEEAAAVIDSVVIAETSHSEEVAVTVGFGVAGEVLHPEEAEAAVGFGVMAETLQPEEAGATVDSGVVGETSHSEGAGAAVGFGVGGEVLCSEALSQETVNALREPLESARSLRIVVRWTSDNAGYCAGIIDQFVGTIGRVTIAPEAGGLAPNLGYKITIKDEHGIDVLAGIGTDGFSDTAPQSFVPLINGQMVAVDGWLSVEIEGAGDANSGIVTLHMTGDIACGLARVPGINSLESFCMDEVADHYEIATGLFADNEAPNGVVDSVNCVFTLSAAPYSNSLELYRSDRLLIPGTDYVLSGNTITFTVAPTIPDFRAFYRKDASSSSISIDHEIPAGNVDGINAQFTISSSVVEAGSLRVYVGGELSFDNYQFGAPYIDFDSPPAPGSDIRVFYRKYSRIRFIDEDMLTGYADGVNTKFAITGVPDGRQIKLFEGSEWQVPDIDYALAGISVSFASPPTLQPRAYYRLANNFSATFQVS